MVLNISSWRKIQDGCPEAAVPLSVPVNGTEQQSGEGGHKANDGALAARIDPT